MSGKHRIHVMEKMKEVDSISDKLLHQRNKFKEEKFYIYGYGNDVH